MWLSLDPPPLPPPLIKGRENLPKIESLEGGLRNFLQERGNKAENGGELMQKWWGCHFFIILQFNYIYHVWGESKVSFITFRIFSLLSQPFKILIQVFIVLKPGIICTFMMYSGSLQIPPGNTVFWVEKNTTQKGK